MAWLIEDDDWNEEVVDAAHDALPASVRGPVGARHGAPGPLRSRREAVQARRLTLRRQIMDAKEAVSGLRDELRSVTRTNADPALSLLEGRYAYSDALRLELEQAEVRLGQLFAQREALQREWRSVSRQAVAAGS